MARQKKNLAGDNLKSNRDATEHEQRILVLIRLVEKVRTSRSKEESDLAFDAILKLLNDKIEQISYKFKIPGLGFKDVYQEALYALRFKAIKDYDQARSMIGSISPFDRFAMLCIRRHLSTKLKSSYQNKSRVLNSSISLDQDRNVDTKNTDGSLFLSDILPKTKKDIVTQLNENEFYSNLITNLFRKLSVFEKRVLLLYMKHYSYQEISDKINKGQRKIRVNVKSIDNALSRIKIKAHSIYQRYN